MSSILEALKKLEEEKAVKKGGIGNIAGRVTSPRRREKRIPVWALPLAMAGVALCAVLATMAFMGGFAGKQASLPAVTAVPAPPATVQQPAMPLPAPPDSTAAGIAGGGEKVRSVSVAEPGRGSLPGGRAPAPPPSVSPEEAGLPQSTHFEPPGPTQRKNPAVASAAGTSPAPAAPDEPAYQVTGIAWQKDESSRMAIVNGVQVSEGSKVGEATVEEIYPEHVRLKLKGKEVILPWVK